MKTCPLMLLVLIAIGLFCPARSECERELDEIISYGAKGCRISIAPIQERFYIGQPVRIRLVFDNLRENPVHVLQASPLEVYEFDVCAPTGEVAALTPTGRRNVESISTYLEVVPPGESVIDFIPDLSVMFDMTMVGEYTVTVHRNALLSESDHSWTKLTSNTCKVWIHDDETVEREEIAPNGLLGDATNHNIDDSRIKLNKHGHIIEF